MNQEKGPKRAIVNFTQRCALKCEWCYVPFNSQPVAKEKVLSIVERIRDLGFDSVTFGGGDPFQYKSIVPAIHKAKELGLFVHVDTHARGLSESLSYSNLLENFIDLIGLPLDGSTCHIHNNMRSSQGHFELILNKLKWIKSHNIKIKLNTLVSSINIDDLTQLSELILEIKPARWSIYQYWPVGPAERVASQHLLSDDVFSENTNKIDLQKFESKTIVEVNAAESRRKTYPIIHHNGEVYLHTEYPLNRFNLMGSIFDGDILSKIQSCCGTERVQAASRYIATNKSKHSDAASCTGV